MKLPNGQDAIVDDEKLTGYALNPLHREGAKHAELFKMLLGIERHNFQVLRDALLEAAKSGEATSGRRSPFGDKYEIRFPMTAGDRTFTILSVWMIRVGETTPRLVTTYIE